MTTKPKAFSEVRREMGQKLADPSDTMACSYCGAATARDILTSLGARCSVCFGAYCRQGYSGTAPPRQARQCPEVRADQARIAAHMAGREAPRNAFAALSEQLHARKAERDAVRGLASDDDVNALLQMERAP